MAAPDTSSQPTNRRRGRALRNSAIGALVVVAIGAGVGVFGVQQAQGPIDAAKAYCADLKSQNYTAAYGLLSSGYQARVSQTDYLSDAKIHDQIDGKVVDCGQPNSGAFTFSLGTSNTQSLNLEITRATHPQHLDGSITLARQGDSWKVDSVADALQGTDLGGYHLSQTFCANFLAGNYAAAYQLFTAKGQQNYGSEQQFETAFKGAFSGGISLAQCDPDITTYTVTSPASQINLKLSVSETTSLGAQTFPLPNGATLKMALDGGTWKVDELDLNISNV